MRTQTTRALGQLELVGLVARQLHRDLLLAVEPELDAHLEAEVHDARHLRLARAGLGRRARARCRAGARALSPTLLTGPRKRITNGVGGLVVELARRADLLDAAVVHHGDVVGDRHRLLLVVRDEDAS